MDAITNRFSEFFLRMRRAFTPNKIFSCSLILGTFVHEKIFQIGLNVSGLKLDAGGGGGGECGNHPDGPFLLTFLTMKMAFNLNKFWYGIRLVQK